MLDLHICSGLDILIACIPLLFKMPENYYSFMLSGFFRNDVCLFRGLLGLCPLPGAQYFSSRFAVEMSCAPSNHPQCSNPHFSVCHWIKSSSSAAVMCSEMFSFLSVCKGDLSDILLHSTTETVYSLTCTAEKDCSQSLWKCKVCCKIWQDYFTLRPWSSNIHQNMIQ